MANDITVQLVIFDRIALSRVCVNVLVVVFIVSRVETALALRIRLSFLWRVSGTQTNSVTNKRRCVIWRSELARFLSIFIEQTVRRPGCERHGMMRSIPTSIGRWRSPPPTATPPATRVFSDEYGLIPMSKRGVCVWNDLVFYSRWKGNCSKPNAKLWFVSLPRRFERKESRRPDQSELEQFLVAEN